jgi:hypothetical protein
MSLPGTPHSQPESKLKGGLLMKVQFEAEIESLSMFTSAAHLWLDGIIGSIPDIWRRLGESLPLSDEPLAGPPYREPPVNPNGAWASISVANGSIQSRAYSPESVEWLYSYLEKRPRDVSILIALADSSGQLSEQPSVWIRLSTNREQSELAVFSATVEMESKTSIEEVDNLASSWLQLLLRLAASVDPAFAFIGDKLVPLEASRGVRGHELQRSSRKLLRGCGWVTILPRELVRRFGGSNVLSRSSSFAQVEYLPSGAVLFQATAQFSQFNRKVALDSARALSALHLKNADIEERKNALGRSTARRLP